MESEPTVRVAEVFRSLQGEGPSLGAPSTFVRLQGCSVGCTWCDTKYSWPAAGGTALTWPALLGLVADAHITNIVVTGGEPLEHPDFPRLVRELKQRGHRVEVETSGVCAPPAGLAVDQWNVSLKLRHSGVADERRLTASAIAAFRELGERVWWKLVVGAREDVDEVDDIAARFALPRERVLLMPLTVSSAAPGAQREVDALVWSTCVERGYRFTPRAHAAIFGLRRGI